MQVAICYFDYSVFAFSYLCNSVKKLLRKHRVWQQHYKRLADREKIA